MKRILLIAALAACIALAACAGILCACEYQDWQQCVCSMLTEEEQTFSSMIASTGYAKGIR